MPDPDAAVVAWNAEWCQTHDDQPDFIDAWTEATARERQCIKQRVIDRALDMGYEADEVWGVAFPHLADFVHDLLDGDDDAR